MGCTKKPEICARLFDGRDGQSSLLIGDGAEPALFGFNTRRLLEKLGYTVRKVVNERAISEAKRVREYPYPEYDSRRFPKGTTNVKAQVGGYLDSYSAILGLEVRPPLKRSAVNRLGPLLASLLKGTGSDFVLYDDRGDKCIEPLYREPNSANDEIPMSPAELPMNLIELPVGPITEGTPDSQHDLAKIIQFPGGHSPN